jgi:uncharacterized protein (DUF58 family)
MARHQKARQQKARHPGLAEAQALGARLPALLVAAERVAATVAQGVHGRRRAGMGDSFWQYRQAMPGEPASRIDWRQSARSSRAFVRETEWEAAQSVFLWHDPSSSMRWRSDKHLPLKTERAELLLLALASLLLRGGEHVRLLAAGSAHGARASGKGALSRLAAQLVAADLVAARDESADGSGEAGLPPAAFELPRHARLVLIGDMLAEPEAIERLFARLSAIPVDCTVLQVLDPAELSLPYMGRVRFEGLEGEAALLTPRAQDLGKAYQAAMAAHQQRIGALCARAGFALLRHRTDQPPQGALLALFQALQPGRHAVPGGASAAAPTSDPGAAPVGAR